jgi:type II secretory pathway pseudopilin PulG
MVVIVILGVLAALALPAFTGYLRSTKASEATTNLNAIFKTSATFYSYERAGVGMQASVASNCIVETSALTPATLTSQKAVFVAAEGFKRMGFSLADYVYYGYGITSAAGPGDQKCGMSAADASVYTFFARGDLDGDGIQSTFSLSVGIDDNATLYHSRGYFIVAPNE